MTIEVLEWMVGLVFPWAITATVAAVKYWSDSKGWKTSYDREKEASDRAEKQIERTAFITELANVMTETYRKVGNEAKERGGVV